MVVAGVATFSNSANVTGGLTADNVNVTGVLTATSIVGAAAIGIQSASTFIGSGVTTLAVSGGSATVSPVSAGIATITLPAAGVSLGLAIALGG